MFLWKLKKRFVRLNLNFQEAAEVDMLVQMCRVVVNSLYFSSLGSQPVFNMCKFASSFNIEYDSGWGMRKSFKHYLEKCWSFKTR